MLMLLLPLLLLALQRFVVHRSRPNFHVHEQDDGQAGEVTRQLYDGLMDRP